MLGSTCSTVTRAWPLPATRAARMNSRCQTESAAPRARRAKTGTLKMPMAMIELTAPGPSRAVIMTAVSSAGKAKAKSEKRITASLTQPPRAAARAPRGTPKPRPMPTATRATTMELTAPAMIIERMSRPKWSVPSQCPAEGGRSLPAMSISATP